MDHQTVCNCLQTQVFQILVLMGFKNKWLFIKPHPCYLIYTAPIKRQTALGVCRAIIKILKTELWTEHLSEVTLKDAGQAYKKAIASAFTAGRRFCRRVVSVIRLQQSCLIAPQSPHTFISFIRHYHSAVAYTATRNGKTKMMKNWHIQLIDQL